MLNRECSGDDGDLKPKLLIVGNGMVGHHFIEQLCEQGLNERYQVEVFGAESLPAYDRVQLSKYFESGSADALMLASVEAYQAKGIKLHLGKDVVRLDVDNKCLHTADGDFCFYDKLVLATGSYPFVPPIEGKERQHCMVYRTIDDLQQIQVAAENATSGVVIGGGLLGLEAANALLTLGLDTHVVEFAPQLMPVQLNDKAGELLCHKIEELGVSVHTSKATTGIIDGEDSFHRMTFNDDSYLETDLIVFSAGIRPQDSLAKSCGIEVGERGGIVIDDHCLTSDGDVYAIGECALWQQQIFGLVAPGYQMARTAISHLVAKVSGKEVTSFKGADMSTKLKLLGVDVASIGQSRGFEKAQYVELSDNQAGSYKKLWLDESGRFLKGAVLVGDVTDYSLLLHQYLSGDALTAPAIELLQQEAGAGIEFTDESIICSCHQVTKADIVVRVLEGDHSLAAIKGCTKAASGCGGCSALVQQVITQTMESQGLEVSKGICCHFEHDRQALFHLCQVEDIRDFPSLINSHGKSEFSQLGLGCDICKPVAASIFATLENEYVLNVQHANLQDSNDAYLGNLQKDGSYSVVPRIAGGEITPDKLIALGEIAKRHDLYTKITGGQRIDLFGAQLSDLPMIWQELIEQGFETGHAYGKSLRTVKSCVGSTWCRYGVQDSVGLAIDLENRYKGLRAPHKIKFAVSGCTRECAEAQSKDIGVIASDKGWNLYVGGNGGMRPRHGDLFATDLSTKELVIYIDRILMFYTKTAARLQRTSVWLESLEGGLAYLQSVVIEDSLGLAADLETHMEKLVSTYQCEWKTSLENPTFLSRFSEFVNPESMPNLAVEQYGYSRGQRFPIASSSKINLINIPVDESVQLTESNEI
ncbi:nitrite reductase large subunit NirB [Shewanella sp. D64]|uniref:nitrite reductase large subunit NirB n=1 Tax=unclassified Shewanella TaxID=196818 RepID=UPI0022BA277E|nr:MULTISPECIES: nitrite reductase large subunit NirB [unclassified Shewanella]MEC4725761.1 nitrite reductase large subunit NirB [Shewanella sp. D64]MEC4737632.1 nitrite reductase large subunit NirB [Shewanella sp. E94]WBJ98200.1 nitrite reductase large subunit NirB [Shewanella sp. MTB7]